MHWGTISNGASVRLHHYDLQYGRAENRGALLNDVI